LNQIKTKETITQRTRTVATNQTIDTHTYAQSETARRLLRAVCFEGLLGQIYDSATLYIPLHSINSVIVCDQVMLNDLSQPVLQGSIYLCLADQPALICVTDPLIVCGLLTMALAYEVEPEAWQQLVSEVIDSYVHLIQVRDVALQQMQQLQITRQMHNMSLYEWLMQQLQMNRHGDFFETWCHQGHSYHPCHKTRLGFSLDDNERYGPEFSSSFELCFMAIHRDHVKLTAGQVDLDYQDWFAEAYPQVWSEWVKAIQQCGLDQADYLPMPVHPWQLTHRLQDLFQTWIQQQWIVLLPSVKVSCRPTMSFRTVRLQDDLVSPQIKLPVAVQATSAVRTVSPASCENSPRLSAIISQILEQEAGYGQTLQLLPELVSLHATGVEDEIAKHLGVIYRGNPNQCVGADEMFIVVAALFQPIAEQGHPLLIDIMRFVGIGDVAGAKRYFAHYARVVLHAHLDLYLKYGIALESHQQNVCAIFKRGQLQRLLVRDLGGIRIHLPTFYTHGFDFTPYPGSAIVTSDRGEVRNKLIHTVFQYHLGEMVELLADQFGNPTRDYWEIIRSVVSDYFAAHRYQLVDGDWDAEQRALLDEPWVFKALLSMRLKGVYSRYLYVPIPNPCLEHGDVN